MTRFTAVTIALLLAAAPAQGAWRQVDGPVLTPTLTWEHKAVQEPTVLWDQGRYRMWYAGGFPHQRIGYAESRDGIHWRKHPTPLMWDAGHPTVVKTTRGFMMFTGRSNGHLDQSFSHDGIHFINRHTVLRPEPNTWASLVLANAFPFHQGKRWRLLYEALGNGVWQTGLSPSGSPSTGWAPAVKPLRLATGDSMAGGVWRDRDCVYFHSALHGVLPTKMYRRCGRDLYHLGAVQFVFGLQQAWQVDQVADPSIARAPGRQPLMLFSGMDNPNQAGMIGAAWEYP